MPAKAPNNARYLRVQGKLHRFARGMPPVHHTALGSALNTHNSVGADGGADGGASLRNGIKFDVDGADLPGIATLAEPQRAFRRYRRGIV